MSAADFETVRDSLSWLSDHLRLSMEFQTQAEEALDHIAAVVDRQQEALRDIEIKARWYADNAQRDPHEVDHALCVEVLDIAERALGGVCLSASVSDGEQT